MINPPKLKATKLPKSSHEAAIRLIDKERFHTKAYRDQEHRVSRLGSHLDIIRFSLAFQRELKRRGIPFYAFFYLRTHEQQDALYERGVTKAKGGQSPHNYGMAVDLVHSKRLWDLSHKEWALIGTIGKEVARRLNVKITWGGDWSFYDPAHWQLADWRNQKDWAIVA